jgi:hypothetical protein
MCRPKPSTSALLTNSSYLLLGSPAQHRGAESFGAVHGPPPTLGEHDLDLDLRFLEARPLICSALVRRSVRWTDSDQTKVCAIESAVCRFDRPLQRPFAPLRVTHCRPTENLRAGGRSRPRRACEGSVSVAHPTRLRSPGRNAFLLPSQAQDIHLVLLLYHTAISPFARQTHSLPPPSPPVPPDRCSRPDRAVVCSCLELLRQFKVGLPLKHSSNALSSTRRARNRRFCVRLPGPPPSTPTLLCRARDQPRHLILRTSKCSSQYATRLAHPGARSLSACRLFASLHRRPGQSSGSQHRDHFDDWPAGRRCWAVAHASSRSDALQHRLQTLSPF